GHVERASGLDPALRAGVDRPDGAAADHRVDGEVVHRAADETRGGLARRRGRARGARSGGRQREPVEGLALRGRGERPGRAPRRVPAGGLGRYVAAVHRLWTRIPGDLFDPMAVRPVTDQTSIGNANVSRILFTWIEPRDLWQSDLPCGSFLESLRP